MITSRHNCLVYVHTRFIYDFVYSLRLNRSVNEESHVFTLCK